MILRKYYDYLLCHQSIFLRSFVMGVSKVLYKTLMLPKISDGYFQVSTILTTCANWIKYGFKIFQGSTLDWYGCPNYFIIRPKCCSEKCWKSLEISKIQTPGPNWIKFGLKWPQGQQFFFAKILVWEFPRFIIAKKSHPENVGWFF